MAFTLSVLLLAVGLLSSNAERMAENLDDDDVSSGPGSEFADAAKAMQAIFQQQDQMVCGKKRIYDLLTTNNDEDSVRTIPWSDIFEEANEYITEQNTLVTRLTAEVKQLQKQVAEKQAKESPATATKNEIKALVTPAITTAGSFSSVAVAVQIQCGAKRVRGVRERVRPKEARHKIAAAFKVSATAFFNGQKRATSAFIKEVCQEVLPVQGSDQDSFCDEICQDVATIGRELSDKSAGAVAGKSSETLSQKLVEKEQLLTRATSEWYACTQTKTQLEKFREQLQDLGQNIEATSDASMDARYAMFDCEDNIDDLTKNVASQTTITNAAIALVESRTAKAVKAKTELKEAQAAETEVKASMKACETALTNAKTKLTASTEAELVVKKLKGQVTNVLLQMVLYFEEAVRQPLIDLGLGKDTDVNLYFPATPSSMTAATGVKNSLQELATFCEGTAKAAFDNVRTYLQKPLTPLCVLGDTRAAGTEIDNSIVQRINNIKSELIKVQEWLNEYKGQGTMNEAEMQRRVEAGEPRGLRQATSIFANTNFYRNYLRNWNLKFSFQQLVDMLASTITKTTAEKTKLQAELTKLIAKVQKAVKEREDANTAFDAAVKAKEIAKGKQVEASNTLAELQRQLAEAKKLLVTLQAANAQAEAAYNEAVKQLVNTHKTAVSFLELLAGDEEQESAVEINRLS